MDVGGTVDQIRLVNDVPNFLLQIPSFRGSVEGHKDHPRVRLAFVKGMLTVEHVELVYAMTSHKWRPFITSAAK
jgi:hypothetical protein